MHPGLDQPKMKSRDLVPMDRLSPECAARYFDVVGDLDVRELLLQVQLPTLVMHVRDDLMVPIDAGRQMAAGIPSARFLALPGRNHLFLKHKPATARFFDEINPFFD
jgi:pimeloyl-ACP methyl ester carboxylesterase